MQSEYRIGGEFLHPLAENQDLYYAKLYGFQVVVLLYLYRLSLGFLHNIFLLDQHQWQLEHHDEG